MKKSRKVVGAVATVTVFAVCTRLIGFLFKIYLSRALGAEALGVYQIALSVFFLFSSLTSSGVPLILSRKTAESKALGENRSHSLFTTALIVCVSASLTVALVLMLVKDHIVFLFSDPAAHPIFLILIPALVSTAIHSVVRGWLWGEKFFTAFSLSETLEEALRVLFGVFFLSGLICFLSGARAIAWALTVSDLVTAVILFIIFFSKGGRIGKPSDIRGILLPSLPVSAMRICSSMIGTLIAFLLPLRLIAAGMSGAEATAAYGRVVGMATPLVAAPNAVIGSLCVVLIPELSASKVKNDFQKLSKQISLGINFSFLISGLFVAVYSALGKEITGVLYADEISGSYLQVAAFAMLPVSLSQITQSSLNSVGKEYNAFINFLCGNICMLCVIYFLPKIIGIYSVAAASALSSGIISVLNIISLRKHAKLDLGFLKYALLVLLFVLPAFFVGEALSQLLLPHIGLWALLPSLVLTALTYSALCFCTNLLNVRGIIFSRISNKRHATLAKQGKI